LNRPRDRVIDMVDAIEQIERYTDRGRSSFQFEELIRVWVVHHLQILM